MKTLAQIQAKEKILLKGLHTEIHNLEDDPFDDKTLLRKEVTRYFFFKWHKIVDDKKVEWRFSYCVKTAMFGGKYKHVDKYEWLKLQKQFS